MHSTYSLAACSDSHRTAYVSIAFWPISETACFTNICPPILYINTDTNIVQNYILSNGYDRTIVNKLLHKTNNKFITLTYINKQTEKIAYRFKKAGYRIAYKTTNKTEHTLSKRTHKMCIRDSN